MAKEDKRAKFRERIFEVTRRSTKADFDAMTPVQRSHWMTLTYVTEIARVLNPGAFPDDDEDLESGLTDGAGDAGADFICRSEGLVTILQAKYRSPKSDETVEAFDSFSTILSRLHPQSGSGVYRNQKLKDAIADIDWDNDRFELQFLTMGRVAPAIWVRVEAGPTPLKALPGLEDRVDLVLLDETALNDRLRDAESATQGIQEPVELMFQKPAHGRETRWIDYETTGGRRAWVGMIAAKHLANLRKHRSRLFARNIRNYIGDNAKNTAIKQTAIDSPADFFFFNNGIAAIATQVEADVDAGKLICHDFSVINGAQTVRSLIKAQDKAPASAGEARVLIRVTEVELKQKAAEQQFVEQITRFNNTQNQVAVSDFRSNDSVQRSLNKRFRELRRKDGKYYNYKNKRSDERPRDSIAIGMEEFAQTLYAVRFGPVEAKGGKSFLFDATTKGGYQELFGSGGQLWTSVSESDFAVMAGEWFVCSEIRELVKQNRDKWGVEFELEQITKAALERRWLVYYAVGELLRGKCRSENQSYEELLARLGKPKWMDEPESAALPTLVRAVGKSAARVLVMSYKTALQNPTFVQRNWYRAVGTLSEIASQIKLTGVLELLPNTRAGGHA